MGHGMPRCAKIHYRTRTRTTRFGKPAGFPVPVTIPTPDQFKKGTVDDLVQYLIQSACEILQNEQLRMQKGTKEDGQLLIQQLRGK
jgi:hypothetical protein